MKAYKIELLVIDFEGLGGKGIINEIENTKYANYCISPEVKKIKEVDIGEWFDDHPLNNKKTSDEYYKLHFGEKI